MNAAATFEGAYFVEKSPFEMSSEMLARRFPQRPEASVREVVELASAVVGHHGAGWKKFWIGAAGASIVLGAYLGLK